MLVSVNKPPSVRSVWPAYTDTLNLPAHFSFNPFLSYMRQLLSIIENVVDIFINIINILNSPEISCRIDCCGENLGENLGSGTY
jgi:hypothetical protein